MTGSELKGCPCCDSKQILLESSFQGERWMIYCRYCGCHFDNKTYDDVIKRWNTRAKDSSHQLLVDALKAHHHRCLNEGGVYVKDNNGNFIEIDSLGAEYADSSIYIQTEAALKAARGE